MQRDKGLRDTVSIRLRGRPDCFVMPDSLAGRHGGLASVHHSRSQPHPPDSTGDDERCVTHPAHRLGDGRRNANDKEEVCPSRTSLSRNRNAHKRQKKVDKTRTRQGADMTGVSECHLQLRMRAEIRGSRDSDWARQA